ncbi:glycine--tRNA ligase [Entamoeba marina]
MSRVETEYTPEKLLLNKAKLDEVLKQRDIVTQSYEIYGGVSGLFDMGPLGCSLKQNVLQLWRQHFTTYENFYEIETPILTPKCVLEASGHTNKFCDYMVKDVKNGCCFRADHLIKKYHMEKLEDTTLSSEQHEEHAAALQHAESLTPEEIVAAIQKYNIKAPETNNELSAPVAFNLMFQTNVGPEGESTAFLRPETAQGMFTLFKRNLEFNGNKVPFGVTQIGSVFRNEIAPRNGLLRVREFTLAEIEYFVLPNLKTCQLFSDVSGISVNLLSADAQEEELPQQELLLGDAVKNKIISSEILAYFLGRTYLFLLSLGIPKGHIRFRQHMKNEMAHYAIDCWDAEIRLSYGWIECVGHCDRGDYDLKNHARCSKIDHTVHIKYDTPIDVTETKIELNKGVLGKKYRASAKKLLSYVETLDDNARREASQMIKETGAWKLTVDGTEFVVGPSEVTFTEVTKKVHGEKIIPHVIEPSFGVGRLISAILEHSFWVREGSEDKAVLSIPAGIAPVKLGIFPLLSKSEFVQKASEIELLCRRSFIVCKIDTTAVGIGKKYARSDEAGIPFAITVDHKTLELNTVTLRDRDSRKQVRMPISDIIGVIKKLSLIKPEMVFSELLNIYPSEEVKED